MFKIEIYDAGNYSLEEYGTYSEAKWAIISKGAEAHDKLLLNNGKDLRILMNNDEYAIIGNHNQVLFTARVIQ